MKSKSTSDAMRDRIMMGRTTVTASGDTFPCREAFRARGWTWDGAERTWWMLERHCGDEMVAWVRSLPDVKVGCGTRVFDFGRNM